MKKNKLFIVNLTKKKLKKTLKLNYVFSDIFNLNILHKLFNKTINKYLFNYFIDSSYFLSKKVDNKFTSAFLFLKNKFKKGLSMKLKSKKVNLDYYKNNSVNDNLNNHFNHHSMIKQKTFSYKKNLKINLKKLETLNQSLLNKNFVSA
eukprot:GHVN01097516.1.p4 GENE.GHVN01097516.1~~GHVN01097516.1.p4  ORF type:complete len:148 (+),score=3.32 GHVN01097516.1:3819-4262(+)